MQRNFHILKWFLRDELSKKYNVLHLNYFEVNRCDSGKSREETKTECVFHIPDQTGKKPKRAVAPLLDPFADISFALRQELPLIPHSAVSLMKPNSPKLPNRKFNSMYLKWQIYKSKSNFYYTLLRAFIMQSL